jgi:rhamnosyltransferase
VNELSVQPALRSIAAIVVAYCPDALKINKLIAVLGGECETVYILDNGGGREAITAPPAMGGVLQIVDMGGNRGLGEALNRGFRLAAAAGFTYVTTFDQDSAPAAGQITALVSAFEALSSAGAKIAVVGPRIVDLRGAAGLEHHFVHRVIGWPTASPCSAGVRCVATDFLITSGSVISVSAYADVGQYDAGLFVDYTDMEWCFRALSCGYRLFGICTITMHHELSTGALASPLGMTILGYSPIRRYYYARNVLLLSARSHVPAGWKARMIIGLIGRALVLPAAVKFSSGWTAQWYMLGRGILDGIFGVNGPCTHQT